MIPHRKFHYTEGPIKISVPILFFYLVCVLHTSLRLSSLPNRIVCTLTVLFTFNAPQNPCTLRNLLGSRIKTAANLVLLLLWWRTGFVFNGIIHLFSSNFSNIRKFGRLLFEFSKISKSCLRIIEFHYYFIRKIFFGCLIFLGKERIVQNIKSARPVKSALSPKILSI